MPVKKESDLPSTLQKSPAKAKRTFAKTLESAEEQYGEGAAAQRTAYASLKHTHEKRGDRWEPKKEKGPSDPRSRQSSTEAKIHGRGKAFGGVDVEGNSKRELYERARALDVGGRSRMSKEELAEAIARKQG
jgi:cation transport regulator ChaB